jgi:hypothetical protein
MKKIKKKVIVTQRNVTSGHPFQKQHDTKTNWPTDRRPQYNLNLNLKLKDSRGQLIGELQTVQIRARGGSSRKQREHCESRAAVAVGREYLGNPGSGTSSVSIRY